MQIRAVCDPNHFGHPHHPQLYVASSIKGVGSSSWLQSLPDSLPLKLLGEAIKASGIDPPENHRNQAHCGEMLALHQWALANAASTFTKLTMAGGLLVALGEEGPGGQKPLTVKVPCYGTERPGCETVLGSLKLSYLRTCVEHEVSFSTREYVQLENHRYDSVFPQS